MKPTARERYDLICHCRDRYKMTFRKIGQLFDISHEGARIIYLGKRPLIRKKIRIKTIFWNGMPKKIRYTSWN